VGFHKVEHNWAGPPAVYKPDLEPLPPILKPVDPACQWSCEGIQGSVPPESSDEDLLLAGCTVPSTGMCVSQGDPCGVVDQSEVSGTVCQSSVSVSHDSAVQSSVSEAEVQSSPVSVSLECDDQSSVSEAPVEPKVWMDTVSIS